MGGKLTFAGVSRIVSWRGVKLPGVIATGQVPWVVVFYAQMRGGNLRLSKFTAVAAYAAMIWPQMALAQSVDLQGCPADHSKVGYLLADRQELSRMSNGTTSYSPTGVTLFGDAVLGIFRASDTRWLHIRLSRPGATYFSPMMKKYSSAAERTSCGEGYDGCYMKLKDDGRIHSMHSFDFSTFSGRMEKEGEPDGDYLICFYD